MSSNYGHPGRGPGSTDDATIQSGTWHDVMARGWLQTFLGSAEPSQCWLSVRLFCGGQHSRHELGCFRSYIGQPRSPGNARFSRHAFNGDGQRWLSLGLLCRFSGRLNTTARGWLQTLLGSAKRSPRDVGFLPRRHKTAALSMVMVILGFL